MTQSFTEVGRVPSVGERERAELERGASEAASQTDDLLVDVREVERYMHPPADTAYPLEYCFHLLGDVRGRRVLDYGCGTGESSLILALRGADVLCLDISADLLQIARRRLQLNGQTACLIAGSCHATSLPSESVDVIFGVSILHHLDLDLAKREIWRVLRPGGLAIFQEPVRDSKLLSVVRRFVPYCRSHISPFERPLTKGELDRFGIDFVRLSARRFVLPPLSVAHLAFPRASSPFYKVDRILLDCFPALEFYATREVMQFVKPA